MIALLTFAALGFRRALRLALAVAVLFAVLAVGVAAVGHTINVDDGFCTRADHTAGRC